MTDDEDNTAREEENITFEERLEAGKRIEAARNDKELTRQGLGDRFGCDRSQIGRYERGAILDLPVLQLLRYLFLVDLVLADVLRPKHLQRLVRESAGNPLDVPAGEKSEPVLAADGMRLADTQTALAPGTAPAGIELAPPSWIETLSRPANGESSRIGQYPALVAEVSPGCDTSSAGSQVNRPGSNTQLPKGLDAPPPRKTKFSKEQTTIDHVEAMLKERWQRSRLGRRVCLAMACAFVAAVYMFHPSIPDVLDGAGVAVAAIFATLLVADLQAIAVKAASWTRGSEKSTV